jgi:hypothetical protein
MEPRRKRKAAVIIDLSDCEDIPPGYFEPVQRARRPFAAIRARTTVQHQHIPQHELRSQEILEGTAESNVQDNEAPNSLVLEICCVCNESLSKAVKMPCGTPVSVAWCSALVLM